MSRRRPGGAWVALAALVLACSPSATRAGAVSPPGTSCPLFPADNVWHADVSQLPVDPHSSSWISSMGGPGVHLHPDFGPSGTSQPYGIPYDVVGDSHQKVQVSFDYADQSDPGPYPLGPDIAIEGGSDRHALMLDRDACLLYELFDAHYAPAGSTAGSGAVFDLRSNALRPATWTSADAAGLPILPGLVRRDEVLAGVIDHAIRMTTEPTDRRFVWPARHQAGAGDDQTLPPMGARFRLQQGFSLSSLSSFSPQARVILQAMKTYGLMLADNGGDWFFTGAAEDGWSSDVLDELKTVTAASFEAVDSSSLMVDPNSGQAGTQQAATTNVTVQDFSFTPQAVSIPRGGRVEWDFQGPSTHNATDKSGMGFIKSMNIVHGTYAKTFNGAGAYPYLCTIHPSMTGTVKVPVKASPASGGLSTTFKITWAAAAPPSGFVYDVQLKKPNATSFAAWKTGVTTLSANFTPNAGHGTYRFRGRLRRTSNGLASNYSAPASISVT